MKNKMILTVGLPASGKSSWANQWVKDNPNYTIINRDDIRRDILNGINMYGDKKTENKITSIEEHLVLKAYHQEKDIVISDTNLRARDRNKWERFSEFIKYEFILKDFSDVPPEICIERDSKRNNNTETDSLIVGEKVIMGMFNQNLKNNPDNLFIPQNYFKDSVDNLNLPKAILVDIDGTVAHMGDKRKAYEWHKVNLDSVDEEIRSVITLMRESGYQIIFMSGRDSVCRSETLDWLNQNEMGFFSDLFMRKEKDNRPDDIIKHELFWNCVVPKYKIEMAFDDRNRVVKMWRQMGIKCLQVENGDF